jgi:hypothetical protein
MFCTSNVAAKSHFVDFESTCITMLNMFQMQWMHTVFIDFICFTHDNVWFFENRGQWHDFIHHFLRNVTPEESDTFQQQPDCSPSAIFIINQSSSPELIVLLLDFSYSTASELILFLSSFAEKLESIGLCSSFLGKHKVRIAHDEHIHFIVSRSDTSPSQSDSFKIILFFWSASPGKRLFALRVLISEPRWLWLLAPTGKSEGGWQLEIYENIWLDKNICTDEIAGNVTVL